MANLVEHFTNPSYIKAQQLIAQQIQTDHMHR